MGRHPFFLLAILAVAGSAWCGDGTMTVTGECAANTKPIEVECDAPDTRPVVFGGESKSENAYFTDYCLYLDILYDDGTWDYKYRAIFTEGTHDWERQSYVFYPKKPVRRIVLAALARHGSGHARFRNVFVRRGDPGRSVMMSRRIADRPFTDGDVLMNLYTEGNRRTSTAYEQVPDDGRTVGPVSPLPPGSHAVWTADSMVRVTPLTFPDGDRTQPIALELAKDERESAQILVSTAPDVSFDGVRLEIGPLVAQDGEPFRGDVKWERLGYLSRVPEYEPHPNAMNAYERWIPEILLPSAPMRVRKGGTQGAWVTVHAARDARPGIYSCKVRVMSADRSLGEVLLAVKVWDVALPERFGLMTQICLMDGFLKRFYGKGERFARMKRQAVDLVLDHRLSVTDISRTDLPDIEEIAYAKSRGATVANLLNLVPPVKEGEDWVCFASKEAVFTDAFYAYVTNALVPYCGELRRRGLMDMACIYGFDERPQDYYEGIDRMWRRLKRDIPDLPLITSAYMFRDRVKKGEDIPFWTTTDWHVPLTEMYRRDLADGLRKEGKKVFFYTCCGPRYPYWNFANLEYPLIEGRLMGWMAHLERADGFLFWALNFWANSRMPLKEDDVFFPGWSAFSGLQCPGDGVMTYPGENHVLPSIRLANIRDGLEDYEILSLAERRDAAAVERIVAEVAESQTSFTRDPRVLRKARRKLIALAARRDVPAYDAAMLTAAAERISARAKEAPIGFYFITDMHLLDNARTAGALMAELAGRTPVRRVIFGGDIPRAFDPRIGTELKDARAALDWAADEYRDFVGCVEGSGLKVLAVRGNHDFNIARDGKSRRERYSDAEIRELFFGSRGMRAAVRDPANPDALWCYVDEPETNVRYILADTGEDGREGFTAAQAAFLEKAFDSMPAGWRAVVVHHVPVVPVVASTERTYGPFADLRAILERNAGRILIDLTGHHHAERMTFLNGIAHVTEPPDAHYYLGQRNGSLPWTLDRFMRRKGQPNEQCFDAVQIDPGRAIAYFTRIGYGDDKIVHLRASAVKPGIPHRVASRLDDVASWGIYDADRVERVEDPKDRWSPCYRYFTDYAEISTDGTILPKKAGPVVVVARSSSGVREFIPFTVEAGK